eukprot:5365499-Lingulodinium_polyedra.AAC.1
MRVGVRDLDLARCVALLARKDARNCNHVMGRDCCVLGTGGDASFATGVGRGGETARSAV